MKFTGLNQLRKSFLEFFESKGHAILESASLVPQGDNSILLINAGMTPLKKYFQGVLEPPSKRAASCQKCIRTPDIDNVGITARHGTFFEMLGNFSFGDYFKSEACAWAWEYFTEVLQIPADLLWISVYEEDDEARDIWVNEVGIAPERVVRFGKADNFWEHGSGPCGPCSEIYFDRGAEHGCADGCAAKDGLAPSSGTSATGGSASGCTVGCDCDRYIEIWNLVFTQFDSDGKGNYNPLANKNIDTGMGLERLACVMQGAANLFEVDTIKTVLGEIERVSGIKYGDGGKNDISVRVITDHVRASTFMIADGVLPSNEGRGYVLRRLMRRAARHGRLLGINNAFLHSLCEKVIESCGEAYPQLNEKKAYIIKTFLNEEESFARTVEKGLELLSAAMSERTSDCIDGEIVFKLHDTFGFPVDLTREILTENALTFDEEKFNELMKIQKDTARANQAFKGGWDEMSDVFAGLTNTFDKGLKVKTKILEVFDTDEHTLIVLEKTPFYAESGGQVGDTGYIGSSNTEGYYEEIDVVDTKKTPSGLSVCYCIKIPESARLLKKGAEVLAWVENGCRFSIMRNHTAAHLLHAALRNVLGEGVQQAGSLVDENRVRFDFTHGQALTEYELTVIERLINLHIFENHRIDTVEMPIETAKKIGAVALFGEKYGDMVSVVKIGEWRSYHGVGGNNGNISIELCGGTHVNHTSELGLFKIISETSVASGVRRIEAVTGQRVLDLLEDRKWEIVNLEEKLKSQATASRQEIARLSAIIASMQAKTAAVDEVGSIGEIKLFTQKIPGADANAIRQAGDKLKDAHDGFAAVVAGESNLFCVCDAKAVAAGLNAGGIVRELAAVTGGKGGGKADSAMAGVGDSSKIDTALSELIEVSKRMISGN